jgi:hypothetical protein
MNLFSQDLAENFDLNVVTRRKMIETLLNTKLVMLRATSKRS